jgi:murein DD-endopeptidase MepM/ murein hydrolase activator NlpD
MCSPLAGHPLDLLPDIVSDPYHPPPNGREGRHMGVDFSYYQWQDHNTIAGVEVQAIFAGKVAAVLDDNHIPYGYTAIVATPLKSLPSAWLEKLPVENEDTLYVLYAHMQAIPQVSIGEAVTCGQILGLVGQTGGEDTPYTIPHLHIEMRLGTEGWQTDEMGFYDTRLSDAARETYLLWRTSGEFRHFDPMLLLGIDPGES